jgi:hypothetical protein
MRIDQGAAVVGSPEWIEASTGLSRGIPALAEKPGIPPFQDPAAFSLPMRRGQRLIDQGLQLLLYASHFIFFCELKDLLVEAVNQTDDLLDGPFA